MTSLEATLSTPGDPPVTEWLIAIVVALYLFVGYMWASFLHAVTASGPDRGWLMPLLHGLFWPLSMLRLAL